MACGGIIKKSLVLFLTLILLSGCAVQFVYNQLDWLIPWYLSDYMELDGDQEEVFDQRLQQYLAWHRSEQLPQYAVFLRSVADRAEQRLSRSDIQYVQTETEKFAEALISRLSPDMVELFAMSTDGQLQDLFQQFDRDNQEFREKYIEVSEKEQRKQRQKEVLRYAQRWTGQLDQTQVNLIKTWSKKFELMGEELEAARLVWQKEFRRILQQRHNREVYQAEFEKLLTDPGFGRSEQLQAKLDKNAALLVDLYLELDRTLTEKQRRKMIHKLRSYADDFATLSGQTKNS